MPTKDEIKEKHIRKDVLDWLLWQRNLGYWSVIDIRHPHPGTPGREGGVSSTPGAADILVLSMTAPTVFFPSIPVAIAVELKVKGKKQEPEQEVFEAEWVANGGTYLLVHNSEELRQEFERLGIPTAEMKEE